MPAPPCNLSLIVMTYSVVEVISITSLPGDSTVKANYNLPLHRVPGSSWDV